MKLSAKPLLGLDASSLFRVAGVCEPCIAPAVAELRGVAMAEESPESVMVMLEHVALLEECGLHIEDAQKAGPSGLAGIRHGLLAILDSLERKVLCSGCFNAVPESRNRVLPWFNEDVARYVETFRCEACFPQAIAETIARFESSSTQAEIDQIGALLKDYSVFIHEWLRGDEAVSVRPVMLGALRSLARGSMNMTIGHSVPFAPGSPR